MQLAESTIEGGLDAFAGVGMVTLPLVAAADVQDSLMIAALDLERLQSLLAGASETLLAAFHDAVDRLGAIARLDACREGPAHAALHELRLHMAGAVTALQFQDMSSQLISHTGQRLRHCADRLAREAMDGDEDGIAAEEAPLRPNPVTQDEMDAGSIELF